MCWCPTRRPALGFPGGVSSFRSPGASAVGVTGRTVGTYATRETAAEALDIARRQLAADLERRLARRGYVGNGSVPVGFLIDDDRREQPVLPWEVGVGPYAPPLRVVAAAPRDPRAGSHPAGRDQAVRPPGSRRRGEGQGPRSEDSEARLHGRRSTPPGRGRRWRDHASPRRLAVNVDSFSRLCRRRSSVTSRPTRSSGSRR